MRWGAILGTLAGLALAAWLLTEYDAANILRLLHQAGAGLLLVAGFHLIQIAFSAAAWRAVAGPTIPRPSLAEYMGLRWIREGINNLLPVAQIGGEVVAARLLRRRGVPLPQAVAGSVGDLTMEMLTQIAFTLLGLGLLMLTIGGSGVVGYVLGGVGIAVLAAAGFVAAQWFGLAGVIEQGLVRLGERFGWEGLGEITGLQEAIRAQYRARGRLLVACFHHSVSWLLGGVEVSIALYVLGHPISLAEGMVIEALGQALKAAGFAVPGAIGVAEGGYVVVCALYGLPAELAIALALVKRLREVGLGVPALAAWQWLEGRKRPDKPAPEEPAIEPR